MTNGDRVRAPVCLSIVFLSFFLKQPYHQQSLTSSNDTLADRFAHHYPALTPSHNRLPLGAFGPRRTDPSARACDWGGNKSTTSTLNPPAAALVDTAIAVRSISRPDASPLRQRREGRSAGPDREDDRRPIPAPTRGTREQVDASSCRFTRPRPQSGRHRRLARVGAWRRAGHVLAVSALQLHIGVAPSARRGCWPAHPQERVTVRPPALRPRAGTLAGMSRTKFRNGTSSFGTDHDGRQRGAG